MQKNKLILILGIGMIFTPLFMIQAVTTTSTTSIKESDKAKIEALRATLIKETAQMKASLGTSRTEIEKQLIKSGVGIKKNLDIQAQGRIRIIIEKIFNKLNAQLGKLSQVDIKISQKINSLEKEGVDMAKAKEEYVIAKTALDKANANILATRIIATEQLSKETSKEAFRSLVKTAEESIKTAGSEYKKVMLLIIKAINQ